jgi:tetratricopeptide (TPR) repeat protein
MAAVERLPYDSRRHMLLVRLALLSCLGVALLAASSSLAHGSAQDEDEDPVATRARGLFERGMEHFRAAEYDGAIAQWEEGFRVKAAPEFLYNIGQAHRRARRPEQALPYYRRYLELRPDAPNRAEVERVIAGIESERAATGRAPAATTTSAPAGDVARSAPARPITRRPWFWATIAGGAAVAAAAIAVGVVVGSRHDPAQQLPPVSFALRF